MATGSELILGFQHDAPGFRAALRALCLRVHFSDDTDEYEADCKKECGGKDLPLGELVPYKTVEALNKKLEAAWKLAVKDTGWKLLGKTANKGYSSDHYDVETPLGYREMSPWTLRCLFDPDEMSEPPETATLGVSISRRYFPCFADWEDDSGTLWPVVFDKKLVKMQKIAQKRICEALPCFKDAVWIVKEQFY